MVKGIAQDRSGGAREWVGVTALNIKAIVVYLPIPAPIDIVNGLQLL